VRFPQKAARQARHPQYEEAPIIQTNCYQDGVWVYLEQTWTLDRWKVTGGWEGVTWPNTTGPYWPVGGRRWESGAATCTAYLAYFTFEDGRTVTHILDTVSFAVGP